MLKLFVGSTVESLKYAEALQEVLMYDFEVTLWYQGIFSAGISNLENLVNSVSKFDYAIFFFTCDDIVNSRNKEKKSVRDNLLFEYGLFMGALGKDHVWFAYDLNDDLTNLPTDISGICSIRYRSDIENTLASVGSVASVIKRTVNSSNSQPKKYNVNEKTEKDVDNIKADNVNYYYRGKNHYNLEEYQKAIDNFTKAIDLEPNNATYYNLQGLSYYYLEEYQKAIDNFTKAIDLKPNDAVYYGNRGDSYHNLKEYQKSIEEYTKAINLEPNKARYYHDCGDNYYYLEEYQKAIEDYYTKAIDLEPNNAMYYSNRGDTYYYLKEYQKAIEDYTKAIDLEPNDAVYYDNRGDTYRNLKEYQKAIEDYTRAIGFEPNNAEYYDKRSKCYAWLGEYEKSSHDKRKATELA